MMSSHEAEHYHAEQLGVFAETSLDMVAAVTLTYADEAIGAVRAANALDLPIAVSFTVETDGRLPTGQALKEAIAEVDAATGNAPAYYMINCAHPTHFTGVLAGGAWVERVRGLRANASKRSHRELNEAPDLDDGDPVELSSQYRDLRQRFGHINVLGGCCGTDYRHIEQIVKACRAAASA